MRLLWWILIVVIVAVYLRYYFRIPAEVAILQTTLSSFTFDMLREKQPLVIQDRVASIDAIKTSWFKHILTTDLTLDAFQEHTAWSKNKFKYLVLHPSAPCEVLLYPSALNDHGVPPEDATLIAIQLAENQMLIVPYRMHMSLQCTMQVRAIGVHDYITRFLPI